MNLIIALIAYSLTVSAQWSETSDNHTTGNLGVGTISTSSDKVSIEGTGKWQLRLKDLTGGTDWRIGSSGSSWAVGGGKFLITNTGNSNDASILIDNQRRVGIGTANPNAKFHIHSNDGGLKLSASSGNSHIWSTNESGNVWQDLEYHANNHLFTQGNLAIGSTATSGDRLSIEGDGKWQLKLRDTDTGGVDWRIGSSSDDWAAGGGKFIITNSGNSGDASITIDNQRRVGIGTTHPQSKLSVNGQIRATEVKVLADISVPDYVFEHGYELRTLKETKEYITKNKHLPEIPSASEIGENGIDLGDMNMRLLKKIEELTLYQIELLEKVEELQSKVEKLENK